MTAASSASPGFFAQALGGRRLVAALCASFIISLIILPTWEASYRVLLGRLVAIATLELMVFALFERWPRRLPSWIARWALQVIGVAVAVPFVVWFVYLFTTLGNPVPFWHDRTRMAGYSFMTVLGLLTAPWMAVSALLRQIKDEARNQALAFELERSEYERKALDARLRLLQAQVEPHFLFNTLANVRELVDSRSPQASAVLGSLIAYLRAAVPRLNEPSTTLQQEIELVRAYLEVMHMRMPDRLQFALDVDEAALPLRCPPMTLLTLVENAVRHGIDPAEEGGRIDVRVRLQDGRCRAEVVDTGMGLHTGSGGLGTGLSTLRERLLLTFGSDAQLNLSAVAPQGVRAEIEFPAQRSSP
ncbi:sensor histidine kinase [Tahibacter amnicola]|uniref:Histidine kinase n=1 Tax=Tahibacter amnicola TaxID=2976241 RepID=A0ABY6BL55_9GAMM|nr:histidine kinase [Tahibacter amnicola]UXI70517.1 histidine kinase [Tahibacter amnicola]